MWGQPPRLSSKRSEPPPHRRREQAKRVEQAFEACVKALKLESGFSPRGPCSCLPIVSPAHLYLQPAKGIRTSRFGILAAKRR
jgi:hypothetical protein